MTTRWSIPAHSHHQAEQLGCPRCAARLTVRLQLPLWLTMLVSPEDERLLVVDGCDGCGHVRARIATEEAAPEPPATTIEAVIGPDRSPARLCARGHRLRAAVRLVDRRDPGSVETPVRICLQCEHATLEPHPSAEAS